MMMSQSNNHSILQILDDAEQICNDVLMSTTMRSNENKRAKQTHPVKSVISLNKFEHKQPLRPLTAYNIFFQLQRERILNNDESSTKKFTEQDAVGVIQERINNWAGIVSHDNNRKHHETSSKNISFGELATKIAAKWKEADAETKALMKVHSKKERDRYCKLKMEAEAALKRPVGLNSIPISNIPIKTQTSSYGGLRCDIDPDAFPSLCYNHRESLGINSLLGNKPSEKHCNSGNIIYCDEDYWNSNNFSDTNQQANMDEMEHFLQCSESVSNGFVGMNGSNTTLLHDTYPTPNFGIKPSYSQNRLCHNYVQQQNLKYREAQLKYQHHLQQFRMMHCQLQVMNTMQYNNVFPSNQVSNDADYFLPLDDDVDIDIDISSDIFVEPLERLYSICNEMMLNTDTSISNETDEYDTELFSMHDNNPFVQMKSFPNVSMNAFDNMNENVFSHYNDYDDDFSLL